MARISELKKDFLHLVTTKKLSHGYIFFGESLHESFMVAQHLASFIEKGKWELSERTFIDALIIEGRSSGIDTVRKISAFLWQKPIVSERRILIVNEAHLLTLPAQHAILKLVEEPPDEALIMFTVSDATALIVPLASRFQKIYVSAEEALHQRLKEVSKDASDGSARLLKAVTGKERKEILKELIENEVRLDEVVFLLMHHLGKNKKRNWQGLKALSYRWMRINQFNTNKRLQLEVALNAIGD